LNQGTFALSINLVGAITGYYIDSSFSAHGYLRAPDGTITTFDGPAVAFTSPSSINPAGEITGQYFSGGTHGFVRAPDGTITIFDVPSATFTSPMQCSYPCGPRINSGGLIAGDYQDASQLFHAFVRAADGTFTTFGDPSAGAGAGLGTFALGINTTGSIIGYYSDANGVNHGFLRTSSGTITTIDQPSTVTTPGYGTVVLGLNDSGAVTGYYTDASGVHGFVRE
jgi:hypothetical protein